MGRKTYNDRIKAALERGRSDIANEVRQERAHAYSGDLQKLAREYQRQITSGNIAGSLATLHVIVEAASKQAQGLANDQIES